MYSILGDFFQEFDYLTERRVQFRVAFREDMTDNHTELPTRAPNRENSSRFAVLSRTWVYSWTLPGMLPVTEITYCTIIVPRRRG